MRAKLIFLLSVMVGLGLLSLPVFAQEESQGNAEIQELSSHQELNLNDDKTLIMDAADVKPGKVTSIVRDTPSTPQGNNAKKLEQQQKPSGSTGDKAKEDPLSFNFLYYIIQKFKISDIMDE
jgi:hypothetical protein